MDLYSSQERRTKHLSEASEKDFDRRKLQMHYTHITFVIFVFFIRRFHTHLLLVPRRRLATAIHLKHQALHQTPSQRDLDYHQVKLLYQVKSRINAYVIHEVLSSSRKLKQRHF